MKKIQILILIFLFGISHGQNLIQGFNQMTPEKRKEVINKMTPEERAKLLKEFRENMMVEELDVPQENQEEFKKVYSEYQEKQKQIKSQFQSEQDYEQLSDEEAKQQLDRSFEIGQQLLNNRREYAGRFMKVVRPQKVLKLYQTEGMMRNKMLDNKSDRSRNSSENGSKKRR